MKLSDLRDEELIFFINLNSHTALDAIIARYKKKAIYLVKDLLNQFPNSGVSNETLVNVCMNNLEKCMWKAKKDKLPLSQYWKQCSLREAVSYLKKNSYTFKNNTFVGLSLDAYVEMENDKVSISDSIGNRDRDEEDLLFKSIESIIYQDSFKLKPEEKGLFLCYIRGYEADEIHEAFPEFSKSKIYRIIRLGRDLLAKEFVK